MNYDIVNGNSTTTGHHTPLYINDIQKASTHYTVEYLRNIGVDKQKIIIGAAFYGRLFSEVDSKDNGIYKQGKFNAYVNYKDLEKTLNSENGYEFFYDENSMASWAYNKNIKMFATFDDKKSIKQKTKYVKDNGLGGIMFWSLNGDKYEEGLLDIIFDTLNNSE
jgi:chitinase